LWRADHKGEFLLGNQRYCYQLTITDFASRNLFAGKALATTRERYAFSVFERAFRGYGLPEAIQQARFDTFIHRYNHERPHQALDMATTASYTPLIACLSRRR
jgi:transposase InsO family protein